MTTGISLPVAMKRDMEREAKREHRSVSSVISFVLAGNLREVGAWHKSDPEEAEGLPEGR